MARDPRLRHGTLSEHNTHLLVDWDTQKNLPLTPDEVSASARRMVWWCCHTCGFSWQASINSRAGGSGCPHCGGRSPWPGVSDVGTVRPEFISWWADDQPITGFLPGSNKVVSWQCPRGHKFDKAIRKFNLVCPECPSAPGMPGPPKNPLSDRLGDLRSVYHSENDIPAELISYNSARRVKWTADCGHTWEAPVYQVVNGNSGCSRCRSHSTGETEVGELLTALGVKFDPRRRNLIPPQELDFYLPDHAIAIEYNGLYWHSETTGKTKNYHLGKWRKCRDIGVRLITVWEDDWRDRRSAVEAMITRELGLSEDSETAARDLDVIQVDDAETKRFLNAHHARGALPGPSWSVQFGLTHPEQGLLAVSAWRQDGRELYLDNYAASKTIDGALDRLLSTGYRWAAERGLSHIVAFADHCLSDEDKYDNLGFIEDEEVPPDYSNVVDGRRYYRSILDKALFRDDPKLKYDPSITEEDLVALNKMHRVWDCGKTRWILPLRD